MKRQFLIIRYLKRVGSAGIGYFSSLIPGLSGHEIQYGGLVVEYFDELELSFGAPSIPHLVDD